MSSRFCVRLIQNSIKFHLFAELRQRSSMCVFYYFARIYRKNIWFAYFTFFVSISLVRWMFRSILVHDTTSRTYQTSQLFESDLQALRAKLQFQKQISRAYSRATYSEIEYQFEFSNLHIRIHVQNQKEINNRLFVYFICFVCFACFIDFLCNIYIDIWINIIKEFQITFVASVSIISAFAMICSITHALVNDISRIVGRWEKKEMISRFETKLKENEK